jgi:thiamine-phosphate pyrophosphorylase
MPARGVYLLTPDDPDTGRLAARVAALLAAGPALLQYRNKSADPALRRAQVRALLPLCAARGIPLVVNDDWRLAADEGAAGAHLGGLDGALAEARQALGADAILGASCYASLDRADAATRAGASYLAFGACFASGTKPDAPRAPLSLFADAARFGLPRVAIGGITADNAPGAIAAGADLVAVIGAVFDAPDPLAALHALQACFTPAEHHPLLSPSPDA